MYAWEKNWVCFADSFSVGSPEGTLTSRKAILNRLKNWMVSHAGWTVVASKGFWTASYYYEYEGVTPGGSYGGDSTGPYDVWSHSGGDIAATRVPWIMLRSPTTSLGTYYILMGHTSSSTSLSGDFYFGVSDQMFQEPVGNALPLPQTGARIAQRPRTDAYHTGGDNATYYLYFSACATDGSFFLTVRRHTHVNNFSGLYMFSLLDPGMIPYDNFMPIIFASSAYSTWRFSCDLRSNSGYYLANWIDWPWQNPKVDYDYFGVSASPCVRRVGTSVAATDFPFDMDGKVYMFPAHMHRTCKVGYAQGGVGGYQFVRPTYIGRVPDLYVAPESGIIKGDVVTDSTGAIKYYFASFNVDTYDTVATSKLKLWIPGTDVPA
jgi:hypothetical protein